MNRYIIEEFYRDPGLRHRLEQAAHRERTRAILAGIAWLVAQVKARLTPRNHAPLGRWIERLG